MSVVETETHGQILVVRMNRPKSLNALNHELRTELSEAWNDFQDSKELEVAIYGGGTRLLRRRRYERIAAGRSPRRPPSGAARPLYGRHVGQACDRGRERLCDGWRVHAGRAHRPQVAVRGALFEISEAKRWLLGGYNHGHLANLPYPIAMEMAMGFRFSAERFHELGFVNRLVDDIEDLLPEALKMGEHLLTLPPASRVNTLHMMRQMQPRPTPAQKPWRRNCITTVPRRPDGIPRGLRREAEAELHRLGRPGRPLPPAAIGGIAPSARQPRCV